MKVVDFDWPELFENDISILFIFIYQMFIYR